LSVTAASGTGGEGHAKAWERYANENAEFYILTDDVDFGTEAGQEHFFRTGREDAERIYAQARRWMGGDPSVALEIGCGIGRLSLAMLPRVKELRAVDVSPTMLRRLRENCAAGGFDHVRTFLPDEGWDQGGPVDFAYTRWVLQHIAEMATIEQYVRRIGGCLRPGGVAHLQLDTRPATAPYRVRNALPDFMLPRTWRRGVRRIRRDPARLRSLFAASGLTVVEEMNAGTEDHVFILRR
jgi:SAM-dependent methyltransferase